jgi:hypothetical protein
LSFLRETITILAVLLVLALSAALAAPLFIDWNARRGWVEERLSAALGGQVRVSGDISVRLLPAPRLDVAGVEWRASGPSVLQLEAGQINLEIAIAPLLQGAVRFVEARLDQPRLVASLGSDGAIALPQPGERGGVVAIERLEIRGGEIVLLRTGAQALRIAGLDADADAASLHGPFRGSGSFSTPDGRSGFRFGAGVAEEDRIRIKLTTEPGSGAPQIDLDGAVISDRAGAVTRLRFEGGAALWASVQADGVSIPWRASGTLNADLSKGRLEPLEVRFGPIERQSTATGAASFDSQAGILSVRLSAQQIDADRLLDSKNASADPKDASGEAVNRLGRMILQALERPARERALTVKVEAASPAVQLGGDTITEASLALELPRSGDDRLSISANLPGRSLIAFDGAVESGAAARFAGKARAAARDLPRLAEWIARADADLADRLRGLPFRTLEISGDIEVSRSAAAARNLDIRADRSTFRGAAAFTAAVAGEPPRVFADLTSPALDLESVPSLQGPARAFQNADLNLSIDARAIRVAGVGGAVVDAGRIRGKLTRSTNRLELERLSVENLGGASLTASGLVDGDGANLNARLEAQRLVELAALVRRVAPGPLADVLNERAVSLSPARIDLSAQASATDGAVELRTMRVEGTARGTRIAVSARPVGDEIEAEAEIASNDTPMLLRQLGIETVPIKSTPASRLTLRAKGSLAAGYSTEGTGDIAGAAVTFSGALGETAGRFGYKGRTRLASKDATPLLQVLALAWPDATASVPVDLSSPLTINGEAIEAQSLEGVLAGARITGNLRFAAAPGAVRRGLSGALNVDRMSLDTITALALGPPPASVKGGPLWSDRPFTSGLNDPPPTSIQLRAKEMNLRGLNGQNFTARLALANGAVALENLSLRIGQTNLTGQMALRRDKADASLSAALDVTTPLALPDQLQANVTARLELAATGRSERALIASLAGAGRARLADVSIARASPGAINAIVALAEKDAIAPDERSISAALQKAFDAAPVRVGALNVDLLAANGVIRAQPAKLDLQAADATFSAALDLRTLTVDQALELVSRVTPPKWTDPNPRVRIVWAGPLQQPTRAIDAAQLVNGLSARAIQRESARIEALDADIRERAMFNRRLRIDEWRRQRDVEIRAFVIEQERQEKLRIEAERRAEAERVAREKQEQLKLEAERRAQEKQKLQDLLSKPPPSPLQLPGAVPPQ